jgi:inositol oxygenase
MKRNYDIRSNLSFSEIKKLNIIHNTYKTQREKINYNFNNYLINKYCRFNNQDNFWTLFHKLDGIVDLSDPDTSMPNSLHSLQTAEAMRQDNRPDWMILTGLIHDMGKIVYIKGCAEDGTSIDTQWSIVGDTFITGTRIPDNIILSEYNYYNQDHKNNINKYQENCGLENCSISFGHDEYLYRLLKANNHTLPLEAEYMIRYHSLYAWHSSDSYNYLENELDREIKPWVQEFNKYDLYTKDDNNILYWTDELKVYYENLVKKYISYNLDIIY